MFTYLSAIKGSYGLHAVPLLISFIFCISHQSFATMQMMRAAGFDIGGPEKLTVTQVLVPELREREVLIKVYASAINRADILQRKGLYPPPAGESEILGLEAAGTVEKLGPGATRWKVGDRVMALLSGGGNAEFVSVLEDHVLQVPEGMTMVQAAAIPEVWLTAYQILNFLAKVQAEEYVLIHAGGSGVGTAAVQLANLAGARPIVTAGSQAKIDRARKLGAIAGFNYKDEEGFATRVVQATGGSGVDVIMDCVGASFWEQNIAAAAVEARWVIYGLLGSGKIDGDILAKLLRKWITLIGTTIRTRSKEYKARIVGSFAEHVLPHFTSGRLQVVVDSVYQLEELADAHRSMESNRNTGKIVISIREEQDSKPKDEL